ncbi:MAG: RidA family protein, partial [bacterium]
MVQIVGGPEFPPAVGPYSPAAVAEPGRPIAFIAGQVASDESGELIGVRDFRAQFQATMENLERVLAALGAGFEDLAYVRGHL